MTDLPLGWAIAPIEQLIAHDAVFKDGDWVESKDQNPHGKVRLIQLADIADSHFIDKSSRFLTYEKALELNCTFLKKGDLLIARMPDPLGRCCRFPFEGEERFVTVVDVCVIRLGSADIEPTYLMRAINSPSIRSKISGLQSGSTRKRISRGNLATVSIPVPPLNEQRRIVEKIEAMFERIDKGVENLRAARSTLALYRQSLLKSAFEGRLTADWRAKNPSALEDPKNLLARIQKERDTRYKAALADWQTALTHWRDAGEKGKKPAKPKRPADTVILTHDTKRFPPSWALATLAGIAYEAVLRKMLDKAKNKGNEKPYLGNINLRWGSFSVDASKTMPIEDHEINRYGLLRGDLVVCEGGEPGRCAVWQGPENSVFIQKALHRIRFTASFNPLFAFYYFCYAADFGLLAERFTGSTIKHLTATALADVPCPICSPAEQTEITRILDARLDAADKMEAEIDAALARAEALRQSILKRAFAGDLVPQDPTDEPASTLLARIKAERAAALRNKTTKAKSTKPAKRKTKA